jgi:branched-chain amino acid transport system ATP-binding protein
MSLLSVQAVSKHFGGVKAVENLSFELTEGKLTSLIGPNGAGKTTFLDVLTGLMKLTKGDIYFEGKKISGLPPHEIAALGIARTFQLVRLFSRLTIIENVMIGRHVKTKAGALSIIALSRFARKEENDSYKKAREVLEFVDLCDLENTVVSSLPLGQQKLAEMARALAADAKLLLLDEPAAGLNPRETQVLQHTLRELIELGKTILLIEHDMGLVMSVSDRVIVLNKGQKLAEGSPDEIVENPEVISAYLGEKTEDVGTGRDYFRL